MHGVLHRIVHALSLSFLMVLVGCHSPSNPERHASASTRQSSSDNEVELAQVTPACAPVLVSEVDSTKPLRFDLELRSRLSEACPIIVADLGCGSCLSLFLENGQGNLQKINRGDQLVLEEKATIPILAEWRLNAKAETQVQVIRFRRKASQGVKYDDQMIECKLEVTVLDDLRCEPSALTVAFPKNARQAEKVFDLVRITRTTTEPPGSPRFDELPTYCRLSRLEKTSTRHLAETLCEQRWTATLSINLPDQAGTTWSKTLFVVVGDQRTVVCVVPFTARRLHGITSLPEQVSFGTANVGSSVTRKVRLTAADQVPFRILSVEASNPACTASIQTADSAERHWLALNFNPQGEGPITGKLMVRTDHPDAPMLELPIEGYGRK
jgi:hypothetical protein